MIKDYLKLSFVNLSQRKIRSWLTMIGIFIGIAAVIALMGLGQGLRAGILSQFDFLGTDMLSVQASGLSFGPPGTGVVEPLSEDLASKIKRINGVEASFNRYIESATIYFNDRYTNGYVASTPMGEDRDDFEIMLNLVAEEGRLLKDIDNKKIMVGNRFKQKDVIGEENVFKKGVEVGDRIKINDKSFEVVGVLEKKGNFIVDGSIIMNEDELLDLFGDEDSTDIIAIKVRNEKEIDKVKEDVEKLLRKERDVKEGEENFQVTSAKAILDTLDSTLAAVNIFIGIIAGISLLVGGIGIMNTMYTSVLERRKEIGIMKAIGAKNSTIFTLFFIESGFLGMVGGLIGIILGLILAYGFAFLGRLFLGVKLIQASVSLGLILGALLFSFVLGTLFGVLPALQASKLQPVDSLKSK